MTAADSNNDVLNLGNEMLLNVKLFARACELAGTSELQIDMPEETTVGEFRKILIANQPELQPVIDSLFVAINAEYANDEQVIPAGSEVACFPPVSGG